MTKKHWVWITIIITLLHLAVTWILTPISGDIIFSRFDGNPYGNPLEPALIGLYFILYFPYILASYYLPSSRVFPAIRFLLYVANSVAWGLLVAWLISKLPFMKKENDPE